MTLHDLSKLSHSVNDMTIETLFPTLLVQRSLEGAAAINARLSARFLREAEADMGGPQPFTNVGGWHSPKSLQDDPDPDVQAVMDLVSQTLTQLTMRTGDLTPENKVTCDMAAWTNVNSEGHYNELHIHRACTWAAVYYVSVPDHCEPEPGKGALELLDPRPSPVLVPTPGTIFRGRRYLLPGPGQLIVFPSWLFHMVHPFSGPGTRVSIACNVSVIID